MATLDPLDSTEGQLLETSITGFEIGDPGGIRTHVYRLKICCANHCTTGSIGGVKRNRTSVSGLKCEVTELSLPIAGSKGAQLFLRRSTTKLSHQRTLVPYIIIYHKTSLFYETSFESKDRTTRSMQGLEAP